MLMLDLVEYVRLMEDNQPETGQRWRRLVSTVRSDVLPLYRGQLVETRGDSLVLTFTQAQPAVQAAFAVQNCCNDLNQNTSKERHFLLRMGIDMGAVETTDQGISGHAANIASRLTTSLAGPSEIVVTAEVRDQLTAKLDADIEDLGECYLKHVKEPVRAYRIGPPGPRSVIEPHTSLMPVLRPTIAVIPFANRSNDPQHNLLGEVLADEVIAALSRTALLHVVSRLSTTAFSGRSASLQEIGSHLRADYVLSGKQYVSGSDLLLSLELASVASGYTMEGWDDRPLKTQLQAIISRDDGITNQLATNVVRCILNQELQRGQTQALPNLDSYTLLINAIVRMHRGSRAQFETAQQMLQELTARHPRVALPYAWLAKWHVLSFNRGFSTDQKHESNVALNCTKRALDSDPDCSLALTIDGFVHTNLLKRFDIAQARYEQALQVNPNESLAWLLKGTLHAFKGEGKQAMEDTDNALKLSPLDPLRYFYESLAATAAHSAGQYSRAIDLAKQSLRANRYHPSTLRAMAIAQSRAGLMEDARNTVKELLKIEPNLTVRSYLRDNPGGAFEIGKDWAEALRRAGLPG